MTEKKCYICGTTHSVCHNNRCEQEGSAANVNYCDICGDEYVNPTWKEITIENKGSWVKNEAAFWSLFNGAREMYLNTKVIPKVEQKVKKTDPYKEHRKIEKSHEFDRWKLNQEKCALCGKDGTRDGNIIKCAVKGAYKMHLNCFLTTENIAQLLNVSFEVALEKLNGLMNPPPKKTIKKQCEVKCFGDFSQNPWNR